MFILQIPSQIPPPGQTRPLPPPIPTSSEPAMDNFYGTLLSPGTQPQPSATDNFYGTLLSQGSPPPSSTDDFYNELSMGIARRSRRSGSPIATLMPRLGATELQANGSYRHANGSHSYYQWGGTVYNTSGHISRSGAPGPDGRHTLGNWTPVNHGLLPSTRAIALQDLVPNPELATNPNSNYNFVRGGEGNTGTYSLQADGSFFYSGGLRDGQNAPAARFVPDLNHRDGGTFAPAPPGNTPVVPMPGTNLISRLRLEPTGASRIFIAPSLGNASVFILPNGNLLAVNPNPRGNNTDVRISDGTGWTDLGQVNPAGGANPGQFAPAAGVTLPAGLTNDNIQTGIGALATSRRPAAPANGGLTNPY